MNVEQKSEMNPPQDHRFYFSRLWPPLVLFAVLLAVTLYGPVNLAVFFAINGVPRVTGTWIWANVTVFGDALVLFAILFPWLHKHPERVLACLFAFMIGTPVLHFLKAAFDVPRPQAVLDAEALVRIGPRYMMHSFPSGHTATAFTIAGVAAMTVRRARTAILSFAFASLVGLSRISAGVHWPADVAAGALLGWGSAAAGVWLAGKFPIARSVSFRRIAGLILFAGLAYAATYYNPRMPQARWTVKAVACAGFAWGMVPSLIHWRKVVWSVRDHEI
jgi:membrane-associated phospholipid phosphatase